MIYNLFEYAAISSASSLSKVTNNVVKINLKEFQIKNLGGYVIAERTKSISIYTPIKGGLDGLALFSISEQHAEMLLKNLNLLSPSKKNEYSTYMISFLSESMNIVIGNFLTNLSLYFNLDHIKHNITIHDELPYHVILNKHFIFFNQKDFLIKVNYNLPTIKIHCEFLYILSRNIISSALERNHKLFANLGYE